MLTEAADWFDRAAKLVPRDDRRVLLSPPRLVARFARFAVRRAAHTSAAVAADDIAARDPALCALLDDLFRALGKYYFRLRVEGVEQVPANGPALLVGNHNGGLVPTDGFFTSLAVHDAQGPKRAVYALGHDFLFDDPLIRSYALRLGILRAGHESAMHAFAAGGLVLVYPGSDLETYRPFGERDRIILGGRTGFIKLALRAGVPIVPVVSTGTHEQFIIVSRGDRLAKLLHAHEWARTEVLPLALSFPWGLTSGFVPYLPLPAQTTVAFGEPMRWPDLGPADAEKTSAVQRCYRDIEERMQQMLDAQSAGRRAWLGKAGARA